MKIKPADLKFLAFVKLCEERVTRGAKYLDKVKPKWYLDTRLDSLDLSNASLCMLGQSFEDFWKKILPNSNEQGYATKKAKGALSISQAQNRGFFLTTKENSEYPEGYDILTMIWVERISQTRLLRKYGVRVCDRALVARR
jgi:hypothetical protein